MEMIKTCVPEDDARIKYAEFFVDKVMDKITEEN